MPELSVLIPARHEPWLARTVRDVLEHARGDTEVIVVLDGAWADPPLPQSPRVTVVFVPQAIGQRAATNLAARISTARAVMKLDAHCSVAEGFDVALAEAARTLGEDVVQVPVQYNLHVHDWGCACGWRGYQAPPVTACPQCGGPVRVEEVWARRERRKTTAWRFDADLHFQYDRAAERAQQGDWPETLSCLGACWYVSRARYWALGGLDERHGSWGQMGTEIACKAWLSGGRLVTNRRTWFAHWFRVGGIGFPYPIAGADQEAARTYSRQLWRENAWPGQVRPLSWLLERFWPVPGWSDEARAAIAAAGAQWEAQRAPAVHTRPSVGIVWYSDSRLDRTIAAANRRQLRRASAGRPIVWVSLTPLETLHPSGRPPADKPPASRVARPAAQASASTRIVVPWPRGYLTMFRQILFGLEALDTDYVCLAEHDVLYAPEHFAEVPLRDDVVLYNQAVWKVDATTGRALHYRCSQTSGLCASRRLLLAHYQARVARVEAEGFSRRMGFEPGTRKIRHGGIDDLRHVTWMASRPNIDVRHAHNLTPSRWRQDQFRDPRYTAGWTEADTVPGWGRTAGRMADFLTEVIHDHAADGE